MSTSTTPPIDPKRTALLAMDFQNGIVSFLADPDGLLERVKEAITDVRAAGGTIGCIRVAFTEDDWDAIPEANKFFTAAASSKMMHHQNLTAQFDERVAPQVGDVVVRKTRFSSIFATGLDQRLRDRDIDTVVLSGISTSGVVLSTLTDAADRDFRVYVLSDGVADPDAEVHEVLVRKVFPSRAHVIDTTHLRELLRGA